MDWVWVRQVRRNAQFDEAVPMPKLVAPANRRVLCTCPGVVNVVAEGGGSTLWQRSGRSRVASSTRRRRGSHDGRSPLGSEEPDILPSAFRLWRFESAPFSFIALSVGKTLVLIMGLLDFRREVASPSPRQGPSGTCLCLSAS